MHRHLLDPDPLHRVLDFNGRTLEANSAVASMQVRRFSCKNALVSVGYVSDVERLGQEVAASYF